MFYWALSQREEVTGVEGFGSYSIADDMHIDLVQKGVACFQEASVCQFGRL